MARAGALRGLPTPLCFSQTRGGAVPYLTPEMLAQCPGEAVCVPFADLMTMGAVDSPHSLGAFLGLGESRATLLLSRDPGHYDVAQNNDKHVALETAHGRRQFTPPQYMAAALRLRPSMLVAVADVVDAAATPKRQTTAVYRTAKWLDACLEATGEDRELLLGVVVGGLDPELRAKSAQFVAERQERLGGAVLAGFGRSDSREARVAPLQAALAALPEALPRVLVGVGQPLEVLDAVALGVDAFTSSYPLWLTEAAFASAFPVPGGGGLEPEAPAPYDGLKLNLRDRRLREDARPMVPGCPCFACQQHSRAYMFHLIECQELTGYALLHAHNETRQQLFFAAIRSHIAEGTFEEYRAEFQSSVSPPASSSPSS